MSLPRQKWIRSLQSSSLVRPPPQNLNQRQTEVLAYVELFGQFASEAFGNDISELVRNHYPHQEACLLDDVLAMFILHHPEHGHVILHALLSCVIDGTILYGKKTPPFGSFISLFSPSSEHLQKDLSEQWALACGEILRVLTHYNRPIYKAGGGHIGLRSIEMMGVVASSSSTATDRQVEGSRIYQDQERKAPTRFLTPWITDSLLAAPLGVRSDYFRWCGGVMGKYAAGGELKPPTTVGACGPGKHPQLMPSTPRWAVANGAAVILSVCEEEVSRYDTADLTAAAVPALLLPPPATALDEHLVAGLPPLEPYARLFHRYYAIATPAATQRLFLGLLEAPPSWAPDALDAAVQLIELLRAAEDYSSSVQLPRNWLHLHFLRPLGAAMSMRSGIAADAAAALLFRVFSQPALLFPPPGHAQDAHRRQLVSGSSKESSVREQKREVAAAKDIEEATARGIASLMCDHGQDVEWRICALWEAACGLLPLNSSNVDLPALVVATPLQPPPLSWNLFRSFLRVFEYLPQGSPSETCLMKIFTATVEVILHRTFPMEEIQEQRNGLARSGHIGLGGFGLKHLAVTELRAMVHSLFTEACPSPDLAARLLSVGFTVCLSHDAVQQCSRNTNAGTFIDLDKGEIELKVKSKGRSSGRCSGKERGAVSTFDSYIVAAVCALACEVQLLSVSAPMIGSSKQNAFQTALLQAGDTCTVETLAGLGSGVDSAVDHARRLLRLLEALLTLVPGGGSSSSGEIVASAVVAAHISELLGKSKACMHAFTAIMRCKWRPDLSAKAATVLGLVEGNGKVVAAVVDSVSLSNAHDVSAKVTVQDLTDLGALESVHEARVQGQSAVSQTQDIIKTLPVCNGCNRGPVGSDGLQKKSISAILKACTGKGLANLPVNASDVASLLCMDRCNGGNDIVGTLVNAVLEEKEDLAVAAVPLLWQRLIMTPELPTGGESTSAKRGWRQAVEALCNVVLVYPGKAASAIVLQAERDLQPWVGNEDLPEFQHLWRVNKRIVCLLTELLRLHSVPEALKGIAKSPGLLERATERMIVDSEACIVTQLELLEAAVVAAQVLVAYDVSAVDSLSKLLKNRLPALVHCLSHKGAHVRALSMALLRDALHSKFGKVKFVEDGDASRSCDGGQAVKASIDDWTRSVEQCIAWELHNLRTMGISISMLTTAADSLGCSVPF